MAPLPCVILARAPRRSDDEDVVFAGCLSVELAQPPRLTHLVLPPLCLATVGASLDSGSSTSDAAARVDSVPGLHDYSSTATSHGNSRRVAAPSPAPRAGPRNDNSCLRALAPRIVCDRVGDSILVADPDGHYNPGLAPSGTCVRVGHSSTVVSNSYLAAAPRADSAVSRANSDRGRVAVTSGDPAADPHGGSMGNPDSIFLVLATDRDAGLLLASSPVDIKAVHLAETVAVPGTSLYVLFKQAGSCTAIVGRVSDRKAPLHPINRLGNLGFMAVPGGSVCLVAELQHDAGSNAARLITIRSDTERWVEKAVAYPEELINGTWAAHGVLSLDGKLHWIDLTRGTISCDPCLDVPTLLYQKLPGGSDVDPAGAYASRCINISGGVIRYAEVRGVGGGARLIVWTRNAGPDGWTLEEEAYLSDIWSGSTYKRTALPPTGPELVLIHPLVPNILYCFVSDHIISINLRSKKVTQFDTVNCSCSHDVLAWELPPFLSPGHYPRNSGFLNVNKWVVHLRHIGAGELLLSARPVTSKTVLNLVLWTGIEFAELRLMQMTTDVCKVCFRVGYTDNLSSANLLVRSSVITVPVPDFESVFKALGLVYKGIPSPCEPTVFTGVETPRGYYVGGQWQVDFVEMSTLHGPIMVLKFHSSDMEMFGAQLFEFPAFHHIQINNYLHRDGYDVRFMATEDSYVQVVSNVPYGIRMVPIPYLSQIRETF